MIHIRLRLFAHPFARALFFALMVSAAAAVRAETPGDFRPKPITNITEKVGATGMKVQPRDTLPKSKAPLVVPTRKPKLAQLLPAWYANTLTFSDGWQLIEAPRIHADGAVLSRPGVDTTDWYNATVPGTVLATLVDQGVYPDPYFGLNNLAIPESLNRQDYWYRTEFSVPDPLPGGKLWLRFNGINYYAEVWLNGTYLGHITGAFIRGEFDVTKWIKPGATNVLAVMVAPPPDPGIPSEQSVAYGPGDNGGTLCLDGPTFVCTEGWDWIPAIRDRCTGIWQSVELSAEGSVSIIDPRVITKLPRPDNSIAELTVQTELRNSGDSPVTGFLHVAIGDDHFKQEVSLQPGETKTVTFTPDKFSQLRLKDPRLWWPNGYGDPAMYGLYLRFVASDDHESDRAYLKFGVREISYEFAVKTPDGGSKRVEFRPTLARGGPPVIDNRRETTGWRKSGQDNACQVGLWPGAEQSPALKEVKDDAMGPYLVIRVNGQKILCQGGNWGMDDAMKRISQTEMEPYVRLHRDANLNMIRNWSGQSTSETFYRLCDKYGILVWNDFSMDTEAWNYNPIDQELFLKNIQDTIKRYRSHPCIAIWCPRNEGVPPEPLHAGIDRAIRELDGTRYYQCNSRLINLRMSGPWSNLPLEKYYQEVNQGFSTELGGSSIPSAEVVRTMMDPADLWPPGDVWAYHDFHSKGAGNRDAILGIIARRYGEAKNLEDLCRKAQMVNYETYRALYEGFNSKMWDSCSGVIVWMSHPSWPSVVWQFYSWDYEPNGAYFGAKKACEPVHIQMTLPDCKVMVINHTAAALNNITASAVIYDLSGRKVSEKSEKLTAAANKHTDALALDWPAEGAYLVRLELRKPTGKLLSENFYWHARDEKQLQALDQLAPVVLQGGSVHGWEFDGETTKITLTNAGSVPALNVRLTLRDRHTGKRILPAFYEDNFISLLPGESRTVRIESNRKEGSMQSNLDDTRVTVDGWNVKPAVFDAAHSYRQ